MPVRFHKQVEHLLMPIEEVHPHEQNPREGDVDAIVESIESNGYTAPAIVQKSTGAILAGSHRYYALLAMGATQIPVIQVDVDDEQAVRILLSDNRTSDLGRYREQDLIDLLVELQDTPQGLLGTAYSDTALEELLTSSVEQQSHGFGAPAQALTVVVTCPDSQTQDEVVELLGEHGYSARRINY